MARTRIPDFESSQPSQAVGSLYAIQVARITPAAVVWVTDLIPPRGPTTSGLLAAPLRLRLAALSVMRARSSGELGANLRFCALASHAVELVSNVTHIS
jgi:hypothetical protein